MPLHEYQCEQCGERFEKIHKFSDPPIEICPKCGGGPVRKLISAPAFHLKGSGWYITDYARKDSGAGGKTDDAGQESAANKDKTGEGGKDAPVKDATAKDGDKKAGDKKDTTAKSETSKSESAPASDGGTKSTTKSD
jgi:putative FmdB family regulatory protein